MKCCIRRDFELEPRHEGFLEHFAWHGFLNTTSALFHARAAYVNLSPYA